MTTFEMIRLSILRKAGLEPVDLEEVPRINWSPHFIQLMKNRMLMGFFRYGSIRSEDAKRYDNVGSAIKRLQKYMSDGNLEHLVDAANLCLCEFVKAPWGRGSHPNPHWTPIDDGEHTEEI